MNINNAHLSHNIFLQARKDNNNTDTTQQGMQKAKELAAQYGSTRMVAVAGDVAVTLKPQTFAEMEAQFSKAKEIEKGVYAFNGEGSNLIINWYKTATVDEGYGPADTNGDGLITNKESMQVRRMINFDPGGNVVLTTPQRGAPLNNENVYISLNDAIERDISSDVNKDGVITTAEVKQKEGIDIELLRSLSSIQVLDSNAIDFGLGAPAKQSASLQQKLQSLDAKIEQLRKQGGVENEQQIKELMATRQTLVAQLQQSGASPSVDVKA